MMAGSVFAGPIDVYVNGKSISRVYVDIGGSDALAIMDIRSKVNGNWLQFDIVVKQDMTIWYTQTVLFNNIGDVFFKAPAWEAVPPLVIVARGVFGDNSGKLTISNSYSGFDPAQKVISIKIDKYFNIIGYE